MNSGCRCRLRLSSALTGLGRWGPAAGPLPGCLPGLGVGHLVCCPLLWLPSAFPVGWLSCTLRGCLWPCSGICFADGELCSLGPLPLPSGRPPAAPWERWGTGQEFASGLCCGIKPLNLGPCFANHQEYLCSKKFPWDSLQAMVR